MNNVVLGSIILICNIMVCNVNANNYVLLSRFDKLCKERYDKGFLTSFVVDDITIREQLMLSWPGELNTPLENPKYAICPGLVIHPSGRFVKRAFPEGLALFWLLRASVRLTCPTNTDSTDSFYLQLDQWIDSLEWSTKHWRPDISKDHEEDVTGGSAGFGEAPDDILRVSCSNEFAGRTTDWSLSGYLRRIRLTWNFINETEVMHSNSTSSMQNINLLNTSSSSTSSASSTSLTTSDDVNSTLLSQRSHHHHHEFRRTSGIQFLVRISSQMLFVGNFSMERKKSLCEFFSGFWCIQSPSSSTVAAGAVVGLNQTNSSTLGNPISSNNNNNPSLPDVVDQAICVQATMRCDNLPDCNLNVPINQMNLSQDEADCELITLINYQLGNASLKSYLSDKYDAWVSKLPWIVLAPVPAILICALIRICTQKRQLDLIEDHHLSMNCSIMHNNASGLDTDHCDKCQQLQYKRSRSNYFLIGNRKSRTGGGGGCGGCSGGSGVGVGAVGGGGLSMAFNSINKLSSVLEVEDEVDDADQQQQEEAEDEEEDENMLAMKILNVMTKSTTYSTAGLIDSTADDNKMLLKHAYSLPECDVKLSSSEQQGDEQSSDHRQQVDWFPPEDRKSACLSLINGKSLSKFNQHNPTVGDVIISNACCIETNRDNGRPTTGSGNIDDSIIHFSNELFLKCRSYNDLQQAMIQKEEDIQMTCLSYSSHLDDDGDDEQMSSVCSSSSSSPTAFAGAGAAVAAASSSSLSSPQVNLPGYETSRSSDIPASFVISSNPDLCIHSLSSPPASPSPSTSTVLSTLQKHLLQSKKYALNRIHHHHHQFFMSSSYPVSKNDHRNNSTTTNSGNSSRSKLLLMESAQSIEDNR